MTKAPMKLEFGKRFRAAREDRKLSRAALAIRLGISPKTIQSWEMGRTFIEDLSLIPAIERELGVAFAFLIGAVPYSEPAVAAESAPAYGAKAKAPAPDDRAVTGPQPPVFAVEELDGKSAKAIEETYRAAPMIKPGCANKDVSELTRRDIFRYVLYPAEWVPRGRVIVAYRMSDSALVPAIPQGGTAIIDRRAKDVERLKGEFAAIWLHDRGLRIRQIDIADDGRIYGKPYGNRKRGLIAIKPEKGDEILGQVLGVMAPLR